MKLIVANWKSHKTLAEAMHWLDAVGPSASPSQHTVVLCPPFPFLIPLGQEIQKKKYAIELGVQDLSQYPAGSYTGAVSVRNLEGLGARYAILGHSERRRYFSETNQHIANKVNLALEAEIQPIVCVDEKQIVSQAAALEEKDRRRCVVAFEPTGHIGTGDPDSVEDVERVAAAIRTSFSSDTKVIYGGSVDAISIHKYLESKYISGVLVGTASLDAKSFTSLLI